MSIAIEFFIAVATSSFVIVVGLAIFITVIWMGVGWESTFGLMEGGWKGRGSERSDLRLHESVGRLKGRRTRKRIVHM